MENLIGIACVAVGAWQWWGVRQRYRQVASGEAVLRSSIKSTTPRGASLEMMGEIMTPVILWLLAIFGLKATALYFMFAGSGYFSLFDLAGLLFLLGSYGFWLVTMTKYREVKPGAAVTAAAAADDDGRSGDGREPVITGGGGPPIRGGHGIRDLATAVAASPEGGKGGQAAA